MKTILTCILFLIFSGALTMSTIHCNANTPLVQSSSIHDFTLQTIDGKSKSLKDYSGKVVLIVNVASFCGYTSQYAGLETLYKQYKDKGFMILGFPANNFGSQEPGTDVEIREFCSTKYNVTFDMFSKISVAGKDKHPLYQLLTSSSTDKLSAGEVRWNFEKFLIDKNGKVVRRFSSSVDPMSEELQNELKILCK